MLPVLFSSFFEQSGFQVVWVGLHFAGGNFFVRRALKAEFANAQSILGSHRRPEHAASHGTRFVELAVPGRRIERGTGLIVGEIGESSLRLFTFVAIIPLTGSPGKSGASPTTASRARARTRAARSGARLSQIGESSL